MADTMQTVPILEVIAHHAGLKSFLLPPVLEAEPGQFVTVWLPGVDEKPFALSGRRPHALEITVKAVGPFTRRLLEARPGDRVGLRGPFGRGFSLTGGAVLVGGGIGNAPLRFLAQRLDEAGLPFSWLAGARQAADLPFEAYLQRDPRVRIFTDDGSAGTAGPVTVGLATALASGPAAVVCGAGPEPMLLALREAARRAGWRAELSFERYMKCGIGLCGQCCLDGSGLRLCVEGPVLDEAAMQGVTEWGLPHRGPSGRRPSAGPPSR
ncbi:MAG: dihydroorotate dehydrogenase electron transfer subunit [Candidatus Riflebacteria bacterium]|nr:dihydroorotate dehydrogenase electron transfer subunit [Candidatus Riflebacteria bacterium]